MGDVLIFVFHLSLFASFSKRTIFSQRRVQRVLVVWQRQRLMPISDGFLISSRMDDALGFPRAWRGRLA